MFHIAIWWTITRNFKRVSGHLDTYKMPIINCDFSTTIILTVNACQKSQIMVHGPTFILDT